MTKRWTIGVASDLAVVGYNHENADLDRPNGEIIREVYYLRAENGRGDARETGRFSSADEAEDFIQLAPPVLLWREARPVYGSQAYVEYGEANDIAAEARHADDEAFGFDTRYAIYY